MCEKLCAERGYQVVGTAEDPDVSAGSTSPFERPSLGRWLREPEQFDVLVFYRVDRLVRSMNHLWQMISWGETHGVDLVSATEADIDTASAQGKLMVTMTATFAEMELEAIRERTRSSYHHLADQGLYTGGIPPFGYEPFQEPHTGDWRLRVEPESAQILQGICKRYLDGESLQSIVNQLNSDKVLTAKDRHDIARGREPKGAEWTTKTLKRMMQSPAILGYAVHGERLTDNKGNPRKKNGRILYGDLQIRRKPDGTPIRRAEGIISEQEYERLQAELARRTKTRASANNKSESLLLRVLYCAECGKPMYKYRGTGYRKDRYRCGSAQYRTAHSCINGAVLVTAIDEFVESEILRIFGESQKLERIWDPGEDNAQELDDVNRSLADIVDLLTSPAYRAGTPQRQKLDQRIQELSERQQALSGQVTRSAEWVWKPTGEIFAIWWSKLTMKQKNDYLRDMGVSAVVRAEKRSELFDLELTLGDLDRMAQQLDLGDVARQVFARRDVLEASGSLGQIVTDSTTVTAFAADAPGPYDEYRERGFTTFVEIAGDHTLALRPDADAGGALNAFKAGTALPEGVELISQHN